MTPEKKLRKAVAQDSSQKLLERKRAYLMSQSLQAFRETISIDSDNELDTKQQIQYGKPWQAAGAIFSDYCNNSTIHGMKYLGERKRPVLERIFWIVVFSFSIYTCVTLIMNIWYKWHYNPVIVSFAEKSTPVWKIPFPAVTICSETKSRQTFFNFTDIYWKIRDYQENIAHLNPTENEISYFNVVAQVCMAHLIEMFTNTANITTGTDIITKLHEVMPNFHETYLECRWRNIQRKCDEIFHTFVTDDGICHSFNSLDLMDIYHTEALLKVLEEFDIRNSNDKNGIDWNLEDGYNETGNIESYPYRVLASGAKAGLELLLNGYQMDFDDLCRGPVQGFKILLHTPGEVAQLSKQYFRLPFEQEMLIAIKPKIITTSDGLKHYEPNKRQCYFQNERALRYFQIYTQNNCELECLANFTLRKCGCVKFSMPRNASISVCGPKKMACLKDAADELALNEFNQSNMNNTMKEHRAATSCNCLPACTSIAYEAEISQAHYEHKNRKGNGKFQVGKSKNTQKSRISIFFKEAQFLTSKRSELYGATDFLANCGGLLGLFMGASTLSLVEILYFCTIRLITNLNMRRKKRQQVEVTLESVEKRHH